jgi:predicted dehydrogenase
VIKVGLIGCGAVASFCHWPALRRMRHVTVVAAADPDAAALARMKQRFHGDTHVAYQELLARPDIDAVVISVRPRTMRQLPARPPRRARRSTWKNQLP